MTEKTPKERIDELKAEREPTPRAYHVEYIEPAGWGGKMRETFKRVECDHIEVTSGLVRFIDATGTDVWAIAADRVVGYREEQP